MSTQGELSDLKIALVHDELTRRGGAERVFEEMVRLFPQADVYALYAGRPQMTIDERVYPVHTTFLQRFPRWFRRHPRRLLALLPYAAEQLDLAQYDVVISSASGFAKGVVTRANIPHICYCHTPTRYAWDSSHEVLGRLPLYQRLPGKAILHFLRLADFAAAQRVDHYIANSHWTQERIQTYYRRPSTVVHPPIDTGFFTPDGRERRSYFLCVGRLVPSKQFEQAIAVCEKLQLPLVIVGEGYHRRALERLAGSRTQFVGRVDRQQLRAYYRRARAVIQPGEEDFGMTAAEALACGTPVIGYQVGGVAEVVRHNEHGLLYGPASVEALAETMRVFLSREEQFSPGVLQQQALRFSRQRFAADFVAQVKHIIATQTRTP